MKTPLAPVKGLLTIWNLAKLRDELGHVFNEATRIVLSVAQASVPVSQVKDLVNCKYEIIKKV